MNENYTHILYILDRSGSMSAVKNDVVSGFNNFIQEQKKQPGTCSFTLVQFDNEYQVIHNFVPLVYVQELEFYPRGSTALYDAIGKACYDTGKELSNLPVFVRPGKVLVIIHTDGEENSSQKYTKQQIGEMIRHQEQVYNWKFVFLGTNFDVMGESSSLNINLGNTLAYTNDSHGISQMYTSLCAGVTSRRGRAGS